MSDDDLAIPAFLDRRPRPIEWTFLFLPNAVGEVSASYADGGVESPSPVAHAPSKARSPCEPRRVGDYDVTPQPNRGGETDLPYTPELLVKLSKTPFAFSQGGAGASLKAARLIAEQLLAHGIALVDPSRARCWIDEHVYSGALFRLRLAEQPPSITLPQDLFP